MHACKLHTPSIKQLSETHLHNIMSNHINASALISQPAVAFWNSYREIGRNVLVVATLFAAVCVEFMADRAQTVSSQRPIQTQNEISAAQGIAVRKMCAPEARLEFVYRLRMLNPPPERGRQGMKRSLGPGTSDVWVLTFVLLHMKLFLRMGSEGPMRGSSATHGAPCLEDLTGVSRSWAYHLAATELTFTPYEYQLQGAAPIFPGNLHADMQTYKHLCLKEHHRHVLLT
ncbi:hypothetical protein NA56DRAFT_711229 [Hyaloscypha hepaticicola]|uniref:Uncharacterized protein n=1 Tax=Hyaloscypha hepaticicola TaxID=2082293 RepID=A0A2J6PJH9_9HELO|nr:hypothetical protein NA56DRAFT_711229 [Hyaloscypha hepaticicola]